MAQSHPVKKKKKKCIVVLCVFLGLVLGGINWLAVSYITGFGTIPEAFMPFLQKAGFIRDSHTLVDYYTYIKGVEYIICVAFFIIFPLYFKILDRKPDPKIPVSE